VVALRTRTDYLEGPEEVANQASETAAGYTLVGLDQGKVRWDSLGTMCLEKEMIAVVGAVPAVHKTDCIPSGQLVVRMGEGQQVARMNCAGEEAVVRQVVHKNEPEPADDRVEDTTSAAPGSMALGLSSAVGHLVLRTQAFPFRGNLVARQICQRDFELEQHRESGSRSLQ
jgi:hypothetical protein